MTQSLRRHRALRAANRTARREPDQVADYPDAHVLRPSWIVLAWTKFQARFGR